MENFDLKKYLTEGKFTKTYLKENQDSTGIVAKFSKYKPLIDLDGTHKQVTFQIQGNLQDEDFQAAKKHLIDQGYEVNQDQSHNDYMEDDDRNIYPRIIFKEVVNEEEAIKENKSLAEIEEAGYKAGEKASYTYATVVTRLQNRPDKLAYSEGFIQGVKDELGSSLNEDYKPSHRAYNVIDKASGEIIDNDLPKHMALKLANKKKGWVISPTDSLAEANSKYPDFDLDKNIKYQDTSISSGMWRYTGKEQGGKGVYRNLSNDQFLGFSSDD
jgi:hypothetical protein